MSVKKCGIEKEVSDPTFGNVVIQSHILKKLSELKCVEHTSESNQFSHFFQQRAHSIWNAALQWDEVCDKANRTAGVQDDVFVDEDKMETENVEYTPGEDMMSSQNPMMDLLYSLDEQTATCEQLTGVSYPQLMSVLQKLSDTGLCHMCNLLCYMSTSEQSRLGSLVCRNLLLPRLQRKSGERQNGSVVKAVINFSRTLPHLSCTEVLLPLMMSPQGDADVLLQIVSEALASEHRDTLLRSFLEREPSGIAEWQIPVIEVLLSPSCDDVVRRQLVQLLSSSSNDLCRNNQFAKLLVSAIKRLGPGASPDLVQQLAAVVSINKSGLKRAAENALNAL